MYSVIIPSLGRVEFLNKLLESIYKQHIKPLEILILLNDNIFCRSAENKIHKNELCKIIFCNDMNLAKKRNFGSNLAKSNFILFSDDDDIWEPNKGQQVLESLKNNDAVTHDFTKFGSKYHGKKLLLGNKNKILKIESLLRGTNIYGGGSSISAKKQIFLSFPFNENLSYCEDYEWWIRVILSEIKVKYIALPLVRYRTHQTNMTSRQWTMFSYKIKIFFSLLYKSFLISIASIVGITKASISLMINLIKNIF